MTLTTRWLGLELSSPLVPSACPLSHSLDTARQLEDAGAGALVMYSLFEEAVREEEEGMVEYLENQATGHAEAGDFLPTHHDWPGELDRYLEQVAALKATLGIPVVASLNGVTTGGWMEHAIEIQDAGADALELNVYYVAADPMVTGQEIEHRYVELLKVLKERVSIPVNLKLGPWFSSLGHFVKTLEYAGADGVALFNRFYQPDIDIESMRLRAALHPSSSPEALLAMRWIAMLHGRTALSLGATSGVHTPEDVIKLLLAGADVVHSCSALLQQGPELISQFRLGLSEWMARAGFEDISEVRGRMSQLNVEDPAAFERTNYVQILEKYAKSPGVWR